MYGPYGRRKPLTIKNIKELIASEQFKNYPASTQEAYKKLLEKKEARHAKRIAEQQARREQEKGRLEETMKSVKVGDVFSASWGYDQTNVDFFQVVALVGKQSVRVKQVYPTMIDENAGMMCADRTYAIPQNGEMLPAAEHSVFIKDQVNGDVKRIESGWGKDPYPIFKLSSFAWATKETKPIAKHYESWYA